MLVFFLRCIVMNHFRLLLRTSFQEMTTTAWHARRVCVRNSQAGWMESIESNLV